MKRCFGLVFVLVASSCGTTQTGNAKSNADGNPAEKNFKHYQQLQEQLRGAQARFIPAIDAFEEARVDYEGSVSAQLLTSKSNARAAKQLTEMASDTARISQDLLQAYRQATDAFPVLAEAGWRVLVVESKLWDLEVQAFRGRAKGLVNAAAEVEMLRGALAELSRVQKERFDALAALTAKEGEVWSTIGEDPNARDAADQQLTELRGNVDAVLTRVVETSARVDAATDQVHKKLLAAVRPSKKELIARIQALLAERAKTVADLVQARNQIKAATQSRIEHRGEEISYDGEFNAVLRGSFKNETQRNNFLGRVRTQRDRLSTTRQNSQIEEENLNNIRKQLTLLEIDTQSLFY